MKPPVTHVSVVNSQYEYVITSSNKDSIAVSVVVVVVFVIVVIVGISGGAVVVVVVLVPNYCLATSRNYVLVTCFKA